MFDNFFAPDYLLIIFSCFSLIASYYLRTSSAFPLLIILILSIYFGLRGDCLPDYSNYMRIYEEWELGDYLRGHVQTLEVEPIYGSLSEAFYTIGVPFYLFVTILLVLSMYLKYTSIEIALGSIAAIALSFYIAKYFVFYELVTIRQGLATSFGILAVAIYDRKKISALLIIIFAGLIHVSVYLFLIIYTRRFFSRVLCNAKYISIAALLSIGFGLISKSIDLAYRLNILPEKIIYYFYQSNDVSEGSSITEPQSLVKTFITIAFFSMLLARQKKIQLNSRFIDSCYLLTGLMVFLRSAFIELPIIAGRASASLGIAECVISGYVFVYSNRFYRILIVGYFIIQFFSTLLLADIYRKFWFSI